jgi:hypothetical protein
MAAQTRVRGGGRKPLSEQERSERRERDRERLEEATRELLSSEGWQRWIRIRWQNGLGRYSTHNLFLLAKECQLLGWADISYVAGYRWWAEHGYQVRKGERGLTILEQAHATAFLVIWMTERACYQHVVDGGHLRDDALIDALVENWQRAVYPSWRANCPSCFQPPAGL